jgi:uracil-DNA glycosylase family 4
LKVSLLRGGGNTKNFRKKKVFFFFRLRNFRLFILPYFIFCNCTSHGFNFQFQMQEDLFGEAKPADSVKDDDLGKLRAYTTLDALYAATKDCQKCRLGATRKNYVFGSGSPTAKIVVIGEAPGADEDEQGLPFVGRSGQLLTKILAAINLTRDEVYICNIAKSRPPNNRPPEKDEIEACMPYLVRQIELIQPKVILALGKTAANTLLNNALSMAAMRGKVFKWNGVDLFVTYHPAALLRNPNWKHEAWADVQAMRKHYDAKYA